MSQDDEPLSGLFEQVRQMCVTGIQGTLPASIPALNALKKTKPELARQIFAECVIALAKDWLGPGGSDEARSTLDEIESRFLQVEVEYLYQDINQLLLMELVTSAFTKLRGDVRVSTTDNVLQPTAERILQSVATSIKNDIVILGVSREKLVTLAMAAALAGKDILVTELERQDVFRKRYLNLIGSTLAFNGFDDEIEINAVVEAIAQLEDDQVMMALCALHGLCFESRDDIMNMLCEELGLPIDIEF